MASDIEAVLAKRLAEQVADDLPPRNPVGAAAELAIEKSPNVVRFAVARYEEPRKRKIFDPDGSGFGKGK